jgi:hypothetical protein
MDQSLLQSPGTSIKRIAQRVPKFRPRVVISALLVIVVIAVAVGVVWSIQRSVSQQSSSAVKSHQQWVTVQTVSGSGSKKTSVLAVTHSWRVVWNCDVASNNNKDYYLYIHAYTTTNALLNNSVEATCSKNNTHGFVQINQGGRIYLSVLSQGSWDIQIQNVK